jgi:hypothetical protein
VYGNTLIDLDINSFPSFTQPAYNNETDNGQEPSNGWIVSQDGILTRNTLLDKQQIVGQVTWLERLNKGPNLFVFRGMQREHR